MKQFVINKGATLPYLEMEPINDGRNDFGKLYNAIQSASVTFSMTDLSTGIKKVANAKAYIVPTEDEDSCIDGFKIQYRWNERDTAVAGRFIASFKITFDGNIVEEGKTYPSGEMIVPIQEELMVVVNDGNLKH